jgi:hypothetical protein
MMFGISVSVMKEKLREKEKEELERSIFDLWLSCWSYEEIAKKLDINHQTAANIVSSKIRKISQNRIEPPESLRIYDVWNFSKCDERLLYNERDS